MDKAQYDEHMQKQKKRTKTGRALDAVMTDRSAQDEDDVSDEEEAMLRVAIAALKASAADKKAKADSAKAGDMFGRSAHAKRKATKALSLTGPDA